MKLFHLKERVILGIAVLLGAITSALSAFISVFLQRIVDVATSRDMEAFTKLVVFMVCYLVIIGCLGFAEALCGKILIRRVSERMRNELFVGILRRSPTEYHGQNSSDYLSVLINDVKLLEENYLIPILLSAQMVVMFLTTLGILFYLSPLVTVTLLFCLVLMFLIPALLGKKMQKRQDAYSEELANFTSCSKDYMNGYDVIYNYHIFAYIFRKFRKNNHAVALKKFSADRILAVNESFSDILSSLSVVAVIFMASYLLLKGEITAGTLMALVQLSSTFVMPVVLFMQNIPKITGMKPIMEKMAALMEDCDDLSFHDGQQDLMQFSREIACENVTFSYGQGEGEGKGQAVLSGLDLTLKAGGKYALLGGSGCGKSTLIKLLTGYTDEFEGRISYDGQSIKELGLPALSQMTAVIHQNVFLFDSDIYENICLGNSYTEEEWTYAIETSGVAEFLPAMEQGLHTPVGENGQYLSGGQRQRIAVARALIRRTPFLVIDEGTSAVDKTTAHEIEKRLLTEEGLTVLAVTHHLDEELLPLYDGVFCIEEGRCCESLQLRKQCNASF